MVHYFVSWLVLPKPMILYSNWVLLKKETSHTSKGQNQGKEASADREEGDLRAPKNATLISDTHAQ